MTFERLTPCLFTLILLGCAEPQPSRGPAVDESIRVMSGRTMGTVWSARFVPRSRQAGTPAIRAMVSQKLTELEAQMSTWRSNSVISRFNLSTDTNWFAIPNEMLTVVQAGQEVAAKTGGAFDITVLPLVELWGFGPGQKTPTTMGIEQIEEAKRSVGMGLLEVRVTPPAIRKRVPNLQIDLSAIAKGYAVDEVAKLLDGYKLTQYLVEIGGELKARGVSPKGRPWRVGIERPEPGKIKVVAAVELKDQAIATSGDYRNIRELGGRSYSHIINPRTGRPRALRSTAVSVIHDSCMIADAWATALTVLDFSEAIRFSEAAGVSCQVIIQIDGELTIRPNSLWGL
jgi:thiamine biosynthesis lipoprotein